jgi:hypothetical protein
VGLKPGLYVCNVPIGDYRLEVPGFCEGPPRGTTETAEQIRARGWTGLYEAVEGDE